MFQTCFVVFPDLSLSHSCKFGYPSRLHFGQYIAILSNLIFKRKQYKNIKFQWLLRQGYPGHITEEGGTRRHPRGTQEAPRGPGSTRRHAFHKSSPLSHQIQKAPQIGDFNMCSVSDSLVFTTKMEDCSEDVAEDRSRPLYQDRKNPYS